MSESAHSLRLEVGVPSGNTTHSNQIPLLGFWTNLSLASCVCASWNPLGEFSYLQWTWISCATNSRIRGISHVVACNSKWMRGFLYRVPVRRWSFVCSLAWLVTITCNNNIWCFVIRFYPIGLVARGSPIDQPENISCQPGYWLLAPQGKTSFYLIFCSIECIAIDGKYECQSLVLDVLVQSFETISSDEVANVIIDVLSAYVTFTLFLFLHKYFSLLGYFLSDRSSAHPMQ